MGQYAFRITSKLGATLEQSMIFSSDYAAIRHGQRLAAPGERLEVWRAGERIFLSEELGGLRIRKTLERPAA